MKKHFEEFHNSFHAIPYLSCSKVGDVLVLCSCGTVAVAGAILKSGQAPTWTILGFFLVLWIELALSFFLNAFGPFILATYTGVITSFYFVEQSLKLDTSFFEYTEFTFFVPVVMGFWGVLGYKIVQAYNIPQWRWILTFTLCFAANVILGKLSGFSDPFPGLPYFLVYVSFSAALCIFVVFGVMRSIEILVYMQEGPVSQLKTLAMELGIAAGHRPNTDQIVLPSELFWLTILDLLFAASFCIGWCFTAYDNQDYLHDNPVARTFHANYIFVGVEVGWGRIIANCLWGLMLFPMACYSYSQWLRMEHQGATETPQELHEVLPDHAKDWIANNGSTFYKINSVLMGVSYLLILSFSFVLAIRPRNHDARSIYMQAGGFMCGLLGYATMRLTAAASLGFSAAGSKNRSFSDYLFLVLIIAYWLWCLIGMLPILYTLSFEDVEKSLQEPPAWDARGLCASTWSGLWGIGIVAIPFVSMFLKPPLAKAKVYYLNTDQLHEATDAVEDWLGKDKMVFFKNMSTPAAFGIGTMLSCCALGGDSASMWIPIAAQWLLLLLVMKFDAATSYISASNGVTATFFYLIYSLEHPSPSDYARYSLFAGIAFSNTLGYVLAKVLVMPKIRWILTFTFSFGGQLVYGFLSSDTQNLDRIQYAEYVVIWCFAHVFAVFGIMRGCEMALNDWIHMAQDHAAESMQEELSEPSANIGAQVVHTSQPALGQGSLLIPPKTLWLKITDICFMAMFGFGWASTLLIDDKLLASNALLEAYGQNIVSLGVAYGLGRMVANLVWAVMMVPLGAFCCTSYCYFVQNSLNQALFKIQGSLLTVGYLFMAGFGMSLGLRPEDHASVDFHTWGMIFGFTGMALLRLSEVVAYCTCYPSPWPKNGDTHVALAAFTAIWIAFGILPYVWYMLCDPDFTKDFRPMPLLDWSSGTRNGLWFLGLCALLVTSWTYLPKDCTRFYICEKPYKLCETYDAMTLWFRNGVWYWMVMLLLRCPYIWYPVAGLTLFVGQQAGSNQSKQDDLHPDSSHFFLYTSGIVMAACYLCSGLFLIIQPQPPFKTKDDIIKQLCKCLAGSAGLNEKLNCYAYTMLLPMGIFFGAANAYLLVKNWSSCTFWNPYLIAASIFAQISWLLIWCFWLGNVLTLQREVPSDSSGRPEYTELTQEPESSLLDTFGLGGIMGTETPEPNAKDDAMIEEVGDQTNCDLFCSSQCGTGTTGRIEEVTKAKDETESLLASVDSSKESTRQKKKDEPIQWTPLTRSSILLTIVGSSIMFGTILWRLAYFFFTHGGLLCY